MAVTSCSLAVHMMLGATESANAMNKSKTSAERLHYASVSTLAFWK
jgi:hypothetical protein